MPIYNKALCEPWNTLTDWAGISEFQIYLFNTGNNFQSYEMLGPHKIEVGDKSAWRFAVWAPNADCVRVAGNFNNWNGEGYELIKIDDTGIWYGVFENLTDGELYKYAISGCDENVYLKTDPFAIECELRPDTASKLVSLKRYKWKDASWIKKRASAVDKPMNIYEVHPGSWRVHEDGSFYSYKELADSLVDYVKDMSYTHIELMPVTEYPFDGSWGYQVTGYFAPTSRYGTADELRYFIEKCHINGISVIMDWVPAHFPRDAHGLRMFDGGPVYEYADTRLGEHKDWGTMVFDYSKCEVISFLMSSAYYWAKEFHFDGLRVDAVSSMLYRDYSRNDGEWVANQYGGNENLEAIDFLKKLNYTMTNEFSGFVMIAEESTAWPYVTKSTAEGGLGFTYKWNMGWMNDTLRYMSMDSYFRKDNHSLLTFLMVYAFSEKFILPLSHDEVVHGKHSLVDKMFGSYEDKFAAYKTLLGYYMSVPGKKLMFMGGELAQFLEWRYEEGLEWHLLGLDKHKKFHDYVKTLNAFYKENKSMWQLEENWDGFRWINASDNETSVLSYMRMAKAKGDYTIVIANFTPVDRDTYKIGVPSAGEYEVVLSSNDEKFGGNEKKTKIFKAFKEPYSDFPYTIMAEIKGNTVMYLKKKKTQKKSVKKEK